MTTYQTSIIDSAVDHIFRGVSKNLSNGQPANISKQKLASKLAMTLAHQLQTHDSALGWGDAVRFAWDVYRNNRDLKLVTFRKVSGEVVTRVVLTEWLGHDGYKPKGTGRKMKPGQIGLVDVAKELSGEPWFISTYVTNVISCYDLRGHWVELKPRELSVSFKCRAGDWFLDRLQDEPIVGKFTWSQLSELRHIARNFQNPIGGHNKRLDLFTVTVEIWATGRVFINITKDHPTTAQIWFGGYIHSATIGKRGARETFTGDFIF